VKPHRDCTCKDIALTGNEVVGGLLQRCCYSFLLVLVETCDDDKGLDSMIDGVFVVVIVVVAVAIAPTLLPLHSYRK
jgi:hypothetical protein